MQNVSAKDLIQRARYAMYELRALGYTREAIATELSRVLNRTVKAHCLEDLQRAVVKRTTNRPLKAALSEICLSVITLHGTSLLDGILQDPTFQADATGLRNTHTRHPLQTGDPHNSIANFCRNECFNLVLASSRAKNDQTSAAPFAVIARTEAALNRAEDLLRLTLALNPFTTGRLEGLGFALTATHRILDLPKLDTEKLDCKQLHRFVDLAKASLAALANHLPEESSTGVVATVSASASYLICRISIIGKDESQFSESFQALLLAGHSLAALTGQSPYTRDMTSAAGTNGIFLLDHAAASLPSFQLNTGVESTFDLLESLPPSTLRPTLGSLAKAPIDHAPHLSRHLASQPSLAERYNQLLANVFNVPDNTPSALKSKLTSLGIRALSVAFVAMSTMQLFYACGIGNVKA